ncbi:MAG: sigma-70 family RNA polymerase sigma factor [Solirubrobacterales bacterium]
MGRTSTSSRPGSSAAEGVRSAVVRRLPTSLGKPKGEIEGSLVRRYRHDGDEGALAALVDRYRPVARSVAQRFARDAEHREELAQVAVVGLLAAVGRFDMESGRPLFPFAYPTMVGEVQRFLRDTAWSMSVPRAEAEARQRASVLGESLRQELGREPTDAELRDRTGLSSEAMESMRSVAHAFQADSLDAPVPGGSGVSRMELHGRADSRFELVDDLLAIGPAMRALPARDREVLQLRFAEGLTQEQIGERVGLSQMQVSRILSRSLARLRSGTAVAA